MYYYRISAENEIGKGPESEMITAEPDKSTKSPDTQDNIFQISIETNLTSVVLCISIVIIIIILILFLIVRRLVRVKPKREQLEEEKLGKEKPDILRSIKERPIQRRPYKKKNDKTNRKHQDKDNVNLMDLIKKK